MRPVAEDLSEIDPVGNAVCCMTTLFFRAALIGLFLMTEAIVYGLAALSIIPTAWRVWQSDGMLLIWRHRALGRLGWLFGPADLRVFARQKELDTLEEWLTEHGVAKLLEGSSPPGAGDSDEPS
jgi:hypothetical protein